MASSPAFWSTKADLGIFSTWVRKWVFSVPREKRSLTHLIQPSPAALKRLSDSALAETGSLAAANLSPTLDIAATALPICIQSHRLMASPNSRPMSPPFCPAADSMAVLMDHPIDHMPCMERLRLFPSLSLPSGMGMYFGISMASLPMLLQNWAIGATASFVISLDLSATITDIQSTMMASIWMMIFPSALDASFTVPCPASVAPAVASLAHWPIGKPFTLMLVSFLFGPILNVISHSFPQSEAVPSAKNVLFLGFICVVSAFLMKSMPKASAAET